MEILEIPSHHRSSSHLHLFAKIITHNSPYHHQVHRDIFFSTSWHVLGQVHGAFGLRRELPQRPSHEAAEVLLPRRRRRLHQIQRLQRVEEVTASCFAGASTVGSKMAKTWEKSGKNWKVWLLFFQNHQNPIKINIEMMELRKIDDGIWDYI